MSRPELNTFLSGLRDLCRDDLLTQKWILAPSLRIGNQWLDAIALAGQPVVCARVMTMGTLALELAGPCMEEEGRNLLSGSREEVLLARLFDELGGRGYLSNLRPGPGLIQTLRTTLQDLRLAGLTANRLKNADFEDSRKGSEIKKLLSGYEAVLKKESLVDRAEILRLAAGRFPDGLKENVLVVRPESLVPEDELGALELNLWRAIPKLRRRSLPVDHPAGPPQGTRLFRAVGAANEVREVLRRCLEEGIPFDQVEILYTDPDTYLPLLFELTTRLAPEGVEQLPVTFLEGLPVRYFRPGRALLAWLSWIGNDYDQAILARMIQDGLLKLDISEMGFARHAALFRRVAIGSGRTRYLKAVEGHIKGLEKAAEPDRFRIAACRRIADLVSALTGKPSGTTQKQRLESAAGFLESRVRSYSRLDEYARKKQIKEIRRLAESLTPGEKLAGLEVFDWLRELPGNLRVGGAGPRPGCLFVAPARSGGHSDRRHTFVLGLDDSRFPGAGLQDPLLLDGERVRLSERLPTASARLRSKVRDFEGLLARVRGGLTLSYESRSLDDDRDLFPANVLFKAFRSLSGQPQGDQAAFLKFLPEPASFAPLTPERCLDATEWWLQRLCATGIRDPEDTLAAHFPNLGRGWIARLQRQSDQFTEYDGYVPQAGRDLNPDLVLSASRLESLGRCPLEYFFKHVLKIRPPEEYLVDPAVWLDPLKTGSLLHEVFYEFMTRITGDGQLPKYDRHRELLEEVLGEQVDLYKSQYPPPNREVFQREHTRLLRTALVFLDDEERYCRDRRPYCFEAAVGMDPPGEGCALDSPDPVALKLPGGTVVRVRGQIDRIDRLATGKKDRFAIWDYKTGSSKKFLKVPEQGPFRRGRLVQNILYLAMAEARLKQVAGKPARVESFGYFFPSPWELGRRVQWSAKELKDGLQVVADLQSLLTGGCFPFTDDPGDLSYSDYLEAFGDVEEQAGRIREKLSNRKNQALDAFRNLRGDPDD